jgi:hypothetical protein
MDADAEPELLNANMMPINIGTTAMVAYKYILVNSFSGSFVI